MSLETAKLPIVKIAAGAVIVLSTVGVGAMTGLIPRVSSQEATAPITSAAPAPTPAAAKTEPSHARPVVKQRVNVAAAPPVCSNCGVVQSMQAIEVKGEGSGLGAVAGGVAGIAVGNQIGNGRGKTLAKIAGAVGGAYAGHQIEKNVKKTVQYQISVRMDDGTVRTFTQASDSGLTTGDHVRVIDNSIVKS